ncbi:MAG: site-specific integrase [Planctomycetaceae bacterium]|nr:site-specific integrase [Planctomycetaceae bacterium]
MSLIKKWTTRGDGKKEQSKKWYGVWRDVDGKKRTKALSKDKTVANQMLAKIVLEVEYQKSGLSNQFTQNAAIPIENHLEEFIAYLKSKGDTKNHVEMSRIRIQRMIEGCGFKRITDISALKVSAWLKQRRTEKSNFGIQTSNRHHGAMGSFCHWLVNNGRLMGHPLKGLGKLNPQSDQRHQRRIMPAEDLKTFLEKVKESKRIDKGADWKFTPESRRYLYLVASLTGLRASELASLKRSSFDLNLKTVTIKATISKHRKEDVLPLNSVLLTELTEWFEKRVSEGDFYLWSGSWAKQRRAGKILQRDLKEQGIPYQDNSGTVFDFHSFRSQFITSLCEAAVPIHEVRVLARHSSPVTTLQHYAKVTGVHLYESINKIYDPVSKG